MPAYFDSAEVRIDTSFSWWYHVRLCAEPKGVFKCELSF
jgi:hypothetical protein